MSRVPAPVLLSLVLLAACAKTLDGDDGSGGSSSTSGGGGGGSVCAKQDCGEPCELCDEPPCNTVCDGQGECRSAYDVTCSDCPDGSDRPTTGEDCPSLEGLVCEYRYGNAWYDFADCRDKITCGVNGWETIPEASCMNFDPAYATCPMMMPQHGTLCDPSEYDSLCDYGGGSYCACSRCLATDDCSGSTAYWGCVQVAEGCPEDAPLLGHACGQEGQVCEYGACWLESTYANGAEFLSTRRTCQGGIWVEESLGCPVQ